MAYSVVALAINYRDARRTADCIRSLQATGAARCVVWDNSADDGVSAQELQNLLDYDERVVVRISEHNLGFAAGVNRGLAVCREVAPESWMLLINNDAMAPPELANALTSVLERNGEALIAFPTLLHAGERVNEVYYHRWLGLITYRPWPGSFRLPRGCCLMLATDRWDGALFDEDFFMYGEEIALGWNLRSTPNAMHLVSTVTVHHEGSATSVVGSAFYEERMVAAHLILARKLAHHPGQTWLLLASRVPILALRALWRSIRFRSLIPLDALRNGINMYLH